MLYYFNFVQTEYFKEAEAGAKADAMAKLAPRALWWFRWGAMLTFLSGIVLLGYKGSGIRPDITLGATMGTLMFLNVWLIIWPNQRIVIASNQAVAAGGDADPAAAARERGRRKGGNNRNWRKGRGNKRTEKRTPKVMQKKRGHPLV